MVILCAGWDGQAISSPTETLPQAAVGIGDTAEAVIERHIQAVGGRERLEAIATQCLQLDAQEGRESFELTVQFKGADQVLLVASLPNGIQIKQGRDDHGSWWRQDPSGVREFSGARHELESLEMALCLNATVWLNLQQGVTALSLEGEEMIGTNRCQVLEATIAEGASLKLCFETGSGLLVQAGGSVLEDYRTQGDVKLPHVIRKGNGSRLEVKNVTFNVPMDVEQFRKPVAPSSGGGAGGGQLDFATSLNPGTQLGLVCRPDPADFGRGKLSELSVYSPDSTNPFQVDLRGTDLSQVNVANRLSDLLHADFDSKTVWPATLPDRFVPSKIMDLGKIPGLRMRELHRRGITGKGIGLGIIDQTLLVDHQEYRDQLKTYEELHSPRGAPAQMHGPAVASIAVGKSVGVAPEADLYYIAEMHGEMVQGKLEWDFTWLAQAIDRLVEINGTLPKEHRIRVISISVGWSPGQKGCAATDAAVAQATQAGIFVISTALERTHQLAFHGLGRYPLEDPDQTESYGLGSWWARGFLNGSRRFSPGERLLVPMDARATASPTGPEDYVYYATGGWSWSVPYLAGLYALACQVDPDITPELFWATALGTGRVISVAPEGQSLELGNIVDPIALVEALQQQRGAAAN